MKIAISGGHLTPALAFIDFLKSQHPNDEIFFFARKYSQKRNQQLSQEVNELESRNIDYILYDSPKLTTNNKINFILQIPKLILAIVEARKILRKNNIEVFLSFGGYLAVPVALAAWSLKIPVITHEQTSELSLANTIISKFAKKVALSFSNKNLQAKKFVLTGNPIRQSLFDKKTTPGWYKNPQKKPLLYITGGSQGSQAINKLVNNNLEKLSSKFSIIHQLGLRNHIDIQESKDYFAREWINHDELPWILQNADLVVSRSGANSVSEFSLFNIPTLFIPLPFARKNEQLKNAQKLAEKKACIILEQKDADDKTFIEKINEIFEQRKMIKNNLEKLEKIRPEEVCVSLYELVVDA